MQAGLHVTTRLGGNRTALFQRIVFGTNHFQIDRLVRTTKRGILLGVVAVGGLVALGYALVPEAETVQESNWVSVVDWRE